MDPKLSTILAAGESEMNWSSESDVEGENIFVCRGFFPRGHKIGEWETRSGELPSILSGISVAQNYSLSASFLDPDLTSEFSPLSHHCQACRHFPKMRLKPRGEKKTLSEFLGSGDTRSDRCGEHSALLFPSLSISWQQRELRVDLSLKHEQGL